MIVCSVCLLRFTTPHHNYGQFLEGQESMDPEVAKARRQQAKDYALMLKNLDRQKVR